MTAIPFKTPEDPITPLQEAFLATLYYAQSLYNYNHESDSDLFCSGSFFQDQLGVPWETYHRRLMDDLLDKGLVRKRRFGRKWHYALTKDGFDMKAFHVKCASHHSYPMATYLR